MKAFVLITLVACYVTLATSIPVAEEDSSKYLKDTVRQKRGGWGYEPVYTTYYHPSPQIHTTVLGPSKTIVTAAHPPITATSAIVVPQRVATVTYPASHSESVVWQTGPDHSYFVHQRHSPRYYYYPTSTTTHILNHGPVVAW